MADNQSYIFGIHSVQATLTYRPEAAKKLYLQEKREDSVVHGIVALAKKNNIAVKHVSRSELDKMTNHQLHQGVVLQCPMPSFCTDKHLIAALSMKDNPFVLVLDGVQDPHNLGACLRSADAMGVDGLIIPKDKSIGLTATVCKVAAGAAETVPIARVTNIVRTMEQLKEMGIWCYGFAGEAEQSLKDVSFTGGVALVMGAEGSGLRRLTKEACDYLVRIPMAGKVESLNVSVATAIGIYEVVRQR